MSKRLLGTVLLFASMCCGQSPSCQAPALKPIPPGANLFRDDLEAEFGAMVHRESEQDSKMIEDEAYTSELKKVGDRLSQFLPVKGLKFHYYIVDSTEANAYSAPGGYIYFTRKIVATFHNEDELAAVMAHEMGHSVTHQSALRVSQQLRDVLGVKELVDADDVDSRLFELRDSYYKKPEAFKEGNVEKEQVDADQVSVYALAAAGYNVQAFASWWDRFTENKGKKGGFFAKIFGTSTEEQRRYRDILKNSSAVTACAGAKPETDTAAFTKWRDAVLGYHGIGHPENLTAVMAVKPLTPPLRSEFSTIRVSPDGRYLLASDQSAIHVLRRMDMKEVNRIDVDDAKRPQFTQDSKAITFYSLELFSSPRVEIWDVEEKSPRAVYEVRVPSGCNQAALSPDGKYFACISPSDSVGAMGGLPFDLRIIATETGNTIVEKKDIFSGDAFSVLEHLYRAIESGQELRVAGMQFSPDSKYLLFGRKETQVAFDAATGAKVNLAPKVKEAMRIDFAFLDNSRMVGVGGEKGDQGTVVSFPAGEVQYSKLKMGLSNVVGVAQGDYAVLSPIKGYEAGIFDFKRNAFISGLKKSSATDVYLDQYFYQGNDGELVLANASDGKDVVRTDLPDSPLAGLTAMAASDDLNYVALSGPMRGAVWDVDGAKRVAHLRRFNSAAVNNAGLLYADFPKEGEGQRLFAQIDTARNTATSFPAPNDESKYYEAGPYLLEWVPRKKGDWKKEVTFQVKSMNDGSLVWKREIQTGFPRYFTSPENDSLVFAYDVSDAAGKTEISNNPALRAKVDQLKTKQHAYGIETFNLKTGKETGDFAVDTGRGVFHLHDAFIASDRLVLVDSEGRVQVFGFDGQLKGRLQATMATASNDGKLLVASLGQGKLGVYDLQTVKKLHELDFKDNLRIAVFSRSGDRLLVVTRDQKAYYFDSKKLAEK